MKKQPFDLVSFVGSLNNAEIYFAFVTDRKSNRIGNICGAFKQITGYSPTNYTGEECKKLLTHCPKLNLDYIQKSKVFFLNYLYNQPKEKRAAISLVRYAEFVCFNGHVCYLSLLCKPILFNRAMHPTGFVYIVSDITHLKKRGNTVSYIIDDNDKENIVKQIFDFAIIAKGHVVSIVEQRILRLLAEGDNSKIIADKLFLSKHTIMTHRKNMLFKFDCASTGELIKMAIMEGWI